MILNGTSPTGVYIPTIHEDNNILENLGYPDSPGFSVQDSVDTEQNSESNTDTGAAQPGGNFEIAGFPGYAILVLIAGLILIFSMD